MNLGHFPDAHVNDGFVPPLDDFTLSHTKGKGLLTGIFGGPKFLTQIAMLAVARAVDRHVLTSLGLRTVARPQKFLGKAHNDTIVETWRNGYLWELPIAIAPWPSE